MNKIEKLKGVITHSTLDDNDRAGMLCQCQVCGLTAICSPRFDFYSCAPGQPLACENCVVKKQIKAPYEQLSRDDHIRITVENTRAACAQIAARVMRRETGLAMKQPGRLPYSTFAEEIRDRILMAPESQSKDWPSEAGPEIDAGALTQENLFPK